MPCHWRSRRSTGSIARDASSVSVVVRSAVGSEAYRRLAGAYDSGARLDTLVGKVARDLGARVILVGRTGSLLADSARPGTRDVPYGSRPEIVSALAGRTVQGRRRSETLNQQLLYTAVPVVKADSSEARNR